MFRARHQGNIHETRIKRQAKQETRFTATEVRSDEAPQVGATQEKTLAILFVVRPPRVSSTVRAGLKGIPTSPYPDASAVGP